MHYASAEPDDDFTPTIISYLRPRAGDNAQENKKKAILSALNTLNEKQLQYVLNRMREL